MIKDNSYNMKNGYLPRKIVTMIKKTLYVVWFPIVFVIVGVSWVGISVCAYIHLLLKEKEKFYEELENYN